MKKNVRSFVDEASNLDSISVMIRNFARQIIEKVRNDLEKQINDIIRSGVNFSDRDERIKLIKIELSSLEGLRDSLVPVYNEKKKELSVLQGKFESKAKKARSNRSQETIEELEEMLGQISELREEIEELSGKINSTGRLHRASVNLTISVFRSEYRKLDSSISKKIYNMERNKARFMAVLDDPELYYQIAGNIISTIVSHTGRSSFLKTIGDYERTSYFEKVLGSMTVDDIEYRPFENINQKEKCILEDGYDMDLLGSETMRNGLLKVIQYAVMKFLEPCRQELFTRFETFKNFSQFDEGIVEKLF